MFTCVVHVVGGLFIWTLEHWLALLRELVSIELQGSQV